VVLDSQVHRRRIDRTAHGRPFLESFVAAIDSAWIYPFPPPPDELVQYVGGGDYLEIGRSLFQQVVEAGLAPDQTILDVGCGAGRVATPLTTYLNNRGRYIGFDVHEASIAWCTENISSHFRNFEFTAHDIRHPYYNCNGAISPLDFRFPCDDSGVDFISAWSVYTHLQLPEIRRYSAEMHRVLRPKGTVLVTAFLLTPEREESEQKSDFYNSMRLVQSGIKAAKPKLPEIAIAFEKYLFLAEITRCGFQLQSLELGTWCGTPYNTFLGYQDRVILQRT
jgi:ubiquinone/menaquinone biosynthesis C-methylase UbiE